LRKTLIFLDYDELVSLMYAITQSTALRMLYLLKMKLGKRQKRARVCILESAEATIVKVWCHWILHKTQREQKESERAFPAKDVV